MSVILVLCIIKVIGSLFFFVFGILMIVVFFMVGCEIRRVLSLVGGIWKELDIEIIKIEELLLM